MNDATYPPVPTRHGSQPDAWLPFVKPLRALMGDRTLPDGALMAQFGTQLRAGDPAMDTLVAWMFDTGISATKPLFMRALEQGIDQVADAPPPLRAFFAGIETPPDWVDAQQLARGADAAAMLGEPLLNGLRDYVLMGGYLSSSINEVLARSGGLEAGPVKRLAETTQWFLDVTAPGGLDRFAPGFIATVRVRWVHALVRRHLSRQPDWDMDHHGLPINQTDMIVTWLGFALAGPLSALLQGQLVLTRADMKAYLHLHKYAHWLMGVDPDALSDDLAHCAWLLANNTLTQPGPSPVSLRMARALADYKLAQNYARFGAVRKHWERHVQLSRSRFFLGRQSMASLGLESHPLPWAPLAEWPGRAVSSVARRFLPGLRGQLIRSGRQRQRELLDAVYLGLDRHWAPERNSRVAANVS
ncbi:MAG: oxygenase MpaB family protein [Oceanococcaceae bacterium]